MAEQHDSTDARPAGFLSRWAQRKAAARHGAAPAAEPELPAAQPPPAAGPDRGALPTPASIPAQTADAADAAASTPAPPSLADVQSLTRESDFSPFMARDVAPGVRNAAMKKLFFSDPHFNLMDGLDIYIDDYTKPAPLTRAMLERMASARLLGLFDDDPPEATPAHGPPLPMACEPADTVAAPAHPLAQTPPPAADEAELTSKRKGSDEHADL